MSGQHFRCHGRQRRLRTELICNTKLLVTQANRGYSHKEITLEVDTDAGITILAGSSWNKFFHGMPSQKSEILLKTYTTEKLEVLGEREVTVEYGKISKKLIATVVKGNGPNLLGRNWLQPRIRNSQRFPSH